MIGFWLFLCRWVKFNVTQDEDALRDTIELLRRQGPPLKLRIRKNKAGEEEYVLCVRGMDRDYARCFTGWRPV